MDLLPTGLFCDPAKVMTAEFADYAWKNDQRIAGMTGQVFTEAYRRQVLQATGTAFDSSAATLALTAVAMEAPVREADALRVVQEARYVLGLDITDLATLGTILGKAGFAEAAAALKSRPPILTAANDARVKNGAAMVRELGGRGVPTLALVDGRSRRLLDGQILYGSDEALLAPFQAAAASA